MLVKSHTDDIQFAHRFVDRSDIFLLVQPFYVVSLKL